ncbi:MAG: fumarylacetoacetate hydrolase family protein [Rhizobiaceae bacterium]|nr:fumarylacetoacetate hydrolase family protein [Rhizobiaceae bacterium]
MFPGLNDKNTLPSDGCAGALVGRVWLPGTNAGPVVVALRDDDVFQLTALTMADLLNDGDVLANTKAGTKIGSVNEILANTSPDNHDADKPWFMSPIDLQSVKAAGVTFVRSMLERVIEEMIKGDASAADEVRKKIFETIGGDIASVVPGSPEAENLKQALIEQGLWSQYLEVGIGPYAEVFTKCPPMASVGTGCEIGIHPESTWNNPEPEAVMVVNRHGDILGATLGNDVNLRDFEGRSALLLGKAKDNNASASIGPFIRLFDDTFSIDDVRQMDIAVEITGEDDFNWTEKSSISEISRDLTDLVSQTINDNHQYPDGFVLYTGTMFSPTKDRGAPGQGFTHHVGDVVTISSPKLGMLINRVNHSSKVAPWDYGVSDLMRTLRARA